VVPNPCVPGGLANLCDPAPAIQAGAFLLTVPNLIWFIVMIALFVLAIVIQLPTKPVDFDGVLPKE
jgi:hypothetical protein